MIQRKTPERGLSGARLLAKEAAMMNIARGQCPSDHPVGFVKGTADTIRGRRQASGQDRRSAISSFLSDLMQFRPEGYGEGAPNFIDLGSGVS
ncbi:hypothetical protein ACVOMV_07410 [Mesorhizobium atlanticum]